MATPIFLGLHAAGARSLHTPQEAFQPGSWSSREKNQITDSQVQGKHSHLCPLPTRAPCAHPCPCAPVPSVPLCPLVPSCAQGSHAFV